MFPLQMTRLYHRSLQILIGYPSTWEDHAENVASSFYCRGLAQNVTMLGFLGESTLNFLSMLYAISLCLKVGGMITDVLPYFRVAYDSSFRPQQP